MALLSIDKLAPSMVLAQDVHNRAGRLLAVKGLVLTEKHQLIFRTWGISEVDIVVAGEGGAAPAPKLKVEVSAAQIAAAMVELQPRFCLVDLRHPLMQGMLQLAAYKKVTTDAL